MSPRLFPRFTRGYMAKREKGGMRVFDARRHLDKDDPGMSQLLRMLSDKKKKKKPSGPNTGTFPKITPSGEVIDQTPEDMINDIKQAKR